MNRQSWGLTLIEVLIALAIMSIALLAVIKVTSQSIRATTYLQDKVMATWVAELVINEIRIGTRRLYNNVSLGEMNLLNRNWFFSVALLSTPNKRINRVNVKIFAREEDRESERTPLMQLESYLYHENENNEN